jgi:hypothetical protein
MNNHVRRTLVIAVSALIAFALPGVAAFDAGEGNTPAGDMLSSALLQAVLALLLLAVLAIPVALAREMFGLRPSWPLWSICFAVAALLALGLLPTFLGRPVRPYDALPALALCAAFTLLAWRSAGRGRQQARTARQRTPETTHRSPAQPFYRPAPEVRLPPPAAARKAVPGPVSETRLPPATGDTAAPTVIEQTLHAAAAGQPADVRPADMLPTGVLPALYRNLLQKVHWDEEMARRLIDYERKHKPDAGPQELLETAIWRWENDNR